MLTLSSFTVMNGMISNARFFIPDPLVESAFCDAVIFDKHAILCFLFALHKSFSIKLQVDNFENKMDWSVVYNNSKNR